MNIRQEGCNKADKNKKQAVESVQDEQKGCFNADKVTDKQEAESLQDKQRRVLQCRQSYKDNQVAESVQDKQRRLLQRRQSYRDKQAAGSVQNKRRRMLQRWQDNINRLKLNNSYKLDDLTVRLFDGRKYLAVSSDSVIEDVANIGEVDNSEIMASIQAKSFAS